MGWTFNHRPKGESIFDFFSREFNYQTDRGIFHVIDCASNFTEAYLAVQSGPNEATTVSGVVCLLRYRNSDYYNFGYKDIGENCGPGVYDCPERILNLLSVTDNQNALEWRQRCQERILRRRSRPTISAGTVIEFSEPLTFKGGHEIRRFKCLNPRRLRFTEERGYETYILRRSTLANRPFRIVSREAPIG